MPLTLDGAARLRVVVAASALAILTCTPDPPLADGFDASRDVSIDALGTTDATEAGADDAVTDAPVPAGDPGWVHVAALPDECDIDVATFPERVAASLLWASDCGSGCLHWGDTANLLNIALSDRVPIAVLVAASLSVDDPRKHFLFAELETGRVLFAMRDRSTAPRVTGQPLCAVYQASAGAGAIAAAVNFFDYDATGARVERAWWSMVTAALGDSRGSVRELYRHADGRAIARVIRVSPTHVGAIYGDSVPVLIGNDGSYVVPTYGTGDHGPIDHLEIFGSADLLWEAWRTPTVMVRSGDGAPPAVLRAVDGGTVRGSDIRGFASDGHFLAWLEGRGYDDDALRYESVELWTAEYEGTELIAPRFVSAVSSHWSGRVGGGYYVHSEPDPAEPDSPYFAVYRLSDGARGVVDPSDLPANEVLFVSASEVIVESFGQIFRVDLRGISFEGP